MTDFRARLQEAWTEDHGRPPTWVEELLLDHYAENMDAEMDRIIGDVTDWQPIGILDATTTITVLPRRPETVEDRVARELVPLVRAAAAEVPLPPRVDVLGGHLREFRTVDAALDQHDGERQWGQFLDRWHLTPDLTRRQHSSSLPCWCDGFMWGAAAVHLDDRVPPGGGWVFEESPPHMEGWRS